MMVCELEPYAASHALLNLLELVVGLQAKGMDWCPGALPHEAAQVSMAEPALHPRWHGGNPLRIAFSQGLFLKMSHRMPPAFSHQSTYSLCRQANLAVAHTVLPVLTSPRYTARLVGFQCHPLLLKSVAEDVISSFGPGFKFIKQAVTADCKGMVSFTDRTWCKNGAFGSTCQASGCGQEEAPALLCALV